MSRPSNSGAFRPPTGWASRNDAYALSRAGLLPVSQFLSLASAYVNEDDASVWSDLASNLHDVNSMLVDEPTYEAFQTVRPAN